LVPFGEAERAGTRSGVRRPCPGRGGPEGRHAAAPAGVLPAA